MSNATPMPTLRRAAIYERQHPGRATDRQVRQLLRMDKRADLRADGNLVHHASGQRSRRPFQHRPRTELRGSFATRVAQHCEPPCREHAPRRRLHLSDR